MAGSWFDGGGSGTPVDVPALWDSAAAELVWRVVASGALVSIGTTSDGGACAVTVTLDGRWRREYFRDSDSLVLWLTDALAAVAADSTRLAASTERGARPARRRAR